MEAAVCIERRNGGRECRMAGFSSEYEQDLIRLTEIIGAGMNRQPLLKEVDIFSPCGVSESMLAQPHDPNSK